MQSWCSYRRVSVCMHIYGQAYFISVESGYIKKKNHCKLSVKPKDRFLVDCLSESTEFSGQRVLFSPPTNVFAHLLDTSWLNAKGK